MNIFDEPIAIYEKSFKLLKSTNVSDVKKGIGLVNSLMALKHNFNIDQLIYNMAAGYFRLGETRQLFRLFNLYNDPRIYELIERDRQLRYDPHGCNSPLHNYLNIVSSSLLLISFGSFLINRL